MNKDGKSSVLIWIVADFFYIFEFDFKKIQIMKYDFDKVIDRNGTAAVKLEEAKEVWGRADLIPLWVADMDFETSSYIEDALVERAKEEIFGYSEVQTLILESWQLD